MPTSQSGSEQKSRHQGRLFCACSLVGALAKQARREQHLCVKTPKASRGCRARRSFVLARRLWELRRVQHKLGEPAIAESLEHLCESISLLLQGAHFGQQLPFPE